MSLKKEIKEILQFTKTLGAAVDFWGCTDLGQILASSFTSTGELHKLPEYQFPHLIIGTIIISILHTCCED